MGDELAALAELEGSGNSSHPVGKSGLNRRTGMQRSQHGDWGNCGPGRLRHWKWRQLL